MHPMIHQQQRHHGLSLIELMVALAVSAILLLGVATIYTASKRSYQVSHEMAELQENARFTLQTLTREIRMAGYTGCRDIDAISLGNLTTTAPPLAGFKNLAVQPNDGSPDRVAFDRNNYIIGHALIQDDGTATPDFDASLTPIAPIALARTEAITIKGISACSSRMITSNPYAGIPNIIVQGNCHFNQNEAVMITNCNETDLFTITNNPVNTDSQQTLQFEVTGDKDEDKDKLAQIRKRLDVYYDPSISSVKIHKPTASVYYIGANGAALNLYQLRLANGAAATRILVPNVENMLINYGVDIDGDRSVDSVASFGVDDNEGNAAQVDALTGSFETNFNNAIATDDASPRSEERRVGKECAPMFTSRGSPSY